MPIFDYQCVDCEAIFEDLVKSPDDSEGVRCPSCSSRNVARTVSLFAAGSSRTASTRPAASSPQSTRGTRGGGGCGSGCGCHS